MAGDSPADAGGQQGGAAAAGMSASCALVSAVLPLTNQNMGRGIMAGVDPYGAGQRMPHPAHGGLESAIAVSGDEPAGQALSSLRQAGASLVVTLGAGGRPQEVVPAKTLAATPPGQQVATCKPAWPAATFIQPSSAEDAQRVAVDNEHQPFLGHRTVVVENGRIAGVVPVPALISLWGARSRPHL